MANEPKNCWEFWKCSEDIKEDCWTYRKKLGKTCWHVPVVFRPGCSPERMKDCTVCAWYQKLHSSINPDVVRGGGVSITGKITT